ncbi:unnamed protein product [Camellia sinensis]
MDNVMKESMNSKRKRDENRGRKKTGRERELTWKRVAGE